MKNIDSKNKFCSLFNDNNVFLIHKLQLKSDSISFSHLKVSLDFSPFFQWGFFLARWPLLLLVLGLDAGVRLVVLAVAVHHGSVPPRTRPRQGRGRGWRWSYRSRGWPGAGVDICWLDLVWGEGPRPTNRKQLVKKGRHPGLVKILVNPEQIGSFDLMLGIMCSTLTSLEPNRPHITSEDLEVLIDFTLQQRASCPPRSWCKDRPGNEADYGSPRLSCCRRSHHKACTLSGSRAAQTFPEDQNDYEK